MFLYASETRISVDFEKLIDVPQMPKQLKISKTSARR